MSEKWFSPLDSSRRIGSVISVSATEISANLTQAGTGEVNWSYGNKVTAGEVNEFVFIDVGETAILGKLVKVWLEGGERLSVDDIDSKATKNNPIGTIQLLVSINLSTGKNHKGIKQHPRLGAQVFSAHPQLVSFLAQGKNDDEINLPIASLPHDSSIEVHITPEKLFSRHCAILGATGGGKSYSISNIVEQIDNAGGKAILIDATGEFASLPCISYYVGEHPAANPSNKVTFPHWQFSESDIRAFLRPSAQSQSPKLEAAIQSQKIVSQFHAQPGNLPIANFLLHKAGQQKMPFETAVQQIAPMVNQIPWSFINIAEQIVLECVWPNGGTAANPNQTVWGNRADNDVGHCLNLIARIKAYANNPHLKWMIDVDPKLNTIPNILDQFCANPSQGGILRLDLSAVPFEANAREILVNAIGRKLISLARLSHISHTNPLIVFIDEAHQFLNKHIGDESTRFDLDAFGNIAKEGRKYGLNVTIATQRPRDIPEDVLSQIGTLIVHRLTNQYDQEIVKKSVGAIDQRSASFLPILEQGEALLLGVDFPFPLTVKMKMPTYAPISESAKFSLSWQPIPPPPAS